MKETTKKEYITPTVDVVLVELEEGIAQTSGGGSANPGSNPRVGDWSDGGSSGGNWDAD